MGQENGLTKREFMKLIPHLTHNELTQIEYFTNKWNKLIIFKIKRNPTYNYREFICNLCSITQSDKNVQTHIEGRKHRMKLQDVGQLYHPKYTAPKKQLNAVKKVELTPLEKVENVANKKSENANANAKKNTEANKIENSNEKNDDENMNINDVEAEGSTDVIEINDDDDDEKPEAVCELSAENCDQYDVNNDEVAKVEQTDAAVQLTDTEKNEQKDSKNNSRRRLNNNEFRKLIPHLQLEELFLTQVKLEEAWSYLFLVSYKNKIIDAINCTVCKEHLTIKNFLFHLNEPNHKDAIGKVVQFYHPVYTYAKKSEKLANGEEVADEELKEAIEAAIESHNKTSKCAFIEAKRTARYIESVEKDYDKELIDFALNMDMKNEKRIFLEVGLSLSELTKVEFTTDNKEWKKMLTYTDKLNFNANYFCNICSKSLSGIITANCHLNGNLHKANQANVEAIRLQSNKKLSKYFAYRYDAREGISIKNTERSYLRHKMSGAVNKAAEAIETEEKLEKSDESEKVDNTNCVENDDVKKDKRSDTFKGYDKPRLSREIATRSKILAMQSKRANLLADKYEYNNRGLIGVEYVLKLIPNSNDSKTMYRCCLCNIIPTEEGIDSHLTNYTHRYKYFETHYPETLTVYKDRIGHMKYKQFQKVMGIVLAKLSSAVEKYHGLGAPFEISNEYYMKNRNEVQSVVNELPHANQTKGPSFYSLITSNEILNIKENCEYYVPKSAPRFLPIASKSYEKYLLANERKNRSNLSGRSRSPRRDRARSRSRSPKRRSPLRYKQEASSRYERGPKDIWKIYREQISNAAIEVERAYRNYAKNPETHPNYDQEWDRYWRHRKAELQGRGIDHRTYNFQPEWVLFFRDRLEQLFGEDLHNSKINARKNLNIPLDAEEDSEYFMTSKQSNNAYNEPPYKKRRYSTEDVALKHKIPSLLDIKPNIIHALRLMTALEDHLGSLGSKIMELLTNALILEKSFGNNFMALEEKILTPHNCTLLETAMEKLKGIQYAGLLESTKTQAFNKVITNTTQLLKHAEEMGWRYAVEKLDPQLDSERNTKINSKELEQLIDVMQSKRSDVFPLKQKSLSETLMGLMSLQRNPNEPTENRNRPKHANFDEERGYNNSNPTNRSGFPSTIRLNSDDKIRQEANYYSNNPMRNDGIHGNMSQTQSTLSKFDTSLTRNSSYEFPNRSVGGSGSNMNNAGLNVRNNYNNMSYPLQNSNANPNLGNMNNVRGEGTVRNDNFANRGMQGNTNPNYNMNRPTGFYQNAFGNGSNDNWGRFQSNQQQWQPNNQNQQGQQFRNK